MTKPASAPPADVVLLNCRRKIEAYQEAYGLAYVGGQEASSLLRDIDKALAASAQVREAEAWTPAQAGDRALGRNRGKPAPERRCPYCAGRIYTDAGCQNCKVGTTYPKPAPEPVPVAQGDAPILARLRAENANLVAAWQERAESAEASLAACRADAERYEWMRAELLRGGSTALEDAFEEQTSYGPDEFDAAIDAARSQP
jgi:hypothetical protein